MLKVLFTLDRVEGVGVFFEVNEPMEAAPLGESCDDRLFMLMNPSNEIVRDTNVNCPIALAGNDIDKEACGAYLRQLPWVLGSSPRMTP